MKTPILPLFTKARPGSRTDLSQPFDPCSEWDARRDKQRGIVRSRAVVATPSAPSAEALYRRIEADRLEQERLVDQQAEKEAERGETIKAALLETLVGWWEGGASHIPGYKFLKKERNQRKGTLTAWLKICLPPVVQALSNNPDPWGKEMHKASPYFSAAQLMEALHRLQLLDDDDLETPDGKDRRESVQTTLRNECKESAVGLVFQEKGGRLPGTKSERSRVVSHLVGVVQQNLGGTLVELRQRRA